MAFYNDPDILKHTFVMLFLVHITHIYKRKYLMIVKLKKGAK